MILDFEDILNIPDHEMEIVLDNYSDNKNLAIALFRERGEVLNKFFTTG